MSATLCSGDLVTTARALMTSGKGLLAIDESTGTCNARFAAAGIPQTVEARRAYRELLVTTPGLQESISGAILCDETIHQKTTDGVAFTRVLDAAGMAVGIKVDTGRIAMPGHPGETVTEGLDGLSERLAAYARLGASFAKWRAALSIGDETPSRSCIEANADALARYAVCCQEVGLVPVVEPEVLMDGPHTLQRCAEVTRDVLRSVFDALQSHGVSLDAMILKPNMVLAGSACRTQPSVEEVVEATAMSLSRTVPAAVPGVAFLSGGQDAELASARLCALNQRCASTLPWALSFSFGRAIQQPALQIWHGEVTQVAAAQRALRHRTECNRAARRGRYSAAMEPS